MAQKSILSDTPSNLIKKLKSVFVRKGLSVDKIVLFGSYAKGNPKPWSDLDLCIVSPEFGKDYHQELVDLMVLASEVDDMIEPHPYHPKDLADPFDPLAHEILTTGKVIV